MRELSEDLEMQVYAVSDVGLVRTRNEDIAIVDGVLVRDTSHTARIRPNGSDTAVLLGVADGVGGGAAGDEASEYVAEGLSRTAISLSEDSDRVGERISEEAARIHNALLDWGRKEPDHAGMATTFAGVLVYNKSVWWLNAGDSRVYRIDRKGLRQVSRDHSLREISGNPAIPSNIIANCFGSESDFFIDIVPIGEPLKKGDGFLVCSDGLSDLVDDEELEAILGDSQSLQAAGTGMVARAKEYGARDNVTLVLVAIQ